MSQINQKLSRNQRNSNFNFLVNNNIKRKQNEFKHGNYRNYYYKRLRDGELQTDFRLELFEAHPEYFKGKVVLDIGCNSGFITINLARKLLPASVLGIDIDGSLVDKAKRDLEKQKTDSELTVNERKALGLVTFRKVRWLGVRVFQLILASSSGQLHP